MPSACVKWEGVVSVATCEWLILNSEPIAHVLRQSQKRAPCSPPPCTLIHRLTKRAAAAEQPGSRNADDNSDAAPPPAGRCSPPRPELSLNTQRREISQLRAVPGTFLYGTQQSWPCTRAQCSLFWAVQQIEPLLGRAEGTGSTCCSFWQANVPSFVWLVLVVGWFGFFFSSFKNSLNFSRWENI